MAGPQTGSRFFRRPPLQAAALFLLTLLAYLPALGRQEFVGTEDLRARIAGEMLDSGGWAVPRFYGRPILTKPPLAYWALAATFSLTGSRGPAQARLVSVAALAGIVMLLGMAGRAAGGARAGWLAGLGYLLTLNTVKNGVNAEIDPLFSFFVVAGVLAWWRTHDPAARRPGAWALASGLAMGLAAATKGP
ncbi:MAG: ArnT family glycosyltransferase, partial [Planctomycetota bacterium]